MEDLLSAMIQWGCEQPTIRAIVLVGSYARGTARPDSDVDVLFLTTTPDYFRTNEWIHEIHWPKLYGNAGQWEAKDYGLVWSRHLHLMGGLEVELSFGPLDWASVTPIDAGTSQVMRDGYRVLYDPDGILYTLVNALKSS